MGPRTKLVIVGVVAVAAVDLALGFYIEARVRASLGSGADPAVLSAIRTALLAASVLSLAAVAIVLAYVGRSSSRALEAVAQTARSVVDRHTAPEADRNEASLDPSGPVNELVDELDRTMGELTAERNRFAAVLEAMGSAVVALDPDQRVTTVNRAARDLLGLDGDAKGRTLLELLRLPGLRELVERPAPGQSEEADFELPGTPPRHIRARATAQPDRGVVLVLEDFTDLRRLERVRRDFVANVSHELRTPISVIRANAETLLAGGLDEPTRARDFCKAVLRHAERLAKLVSDLLDISRIEVGRYPLNVEPIAVEVSAQRAADALAAEAQEKGLNLSVAVTSGLRVAADAQALEQILLNLVENAVKYTPAGGAVEVASERSGEDMVRVEVRDDGPGIDPAHRKRIYERFYRVDPGRSRAEGGTGLGLAIVKNLVEAMGGTVGVDPRSPQGSAFWFTLPTP